MELEGDALIVMFALQNEGERDLSPFGNIIADIQQAMQAFTQRKTMFNGRATNKVAHRLAILSLTLDNLVIWFEEPPDVVLDLLFEDTF